MRRRRPRPELDEPDVSRAKYGLIVVALSAATLTVALAIAVKLAALPAGFIG